MRSGFADSASHPLPIQEFEANSFPCTIDDPDVSCSSSYHLSKITVQVADSIDIENYESRCAKEVHNNKEIKAMKVLSDHDLDLSDIALDELYEFGADSAGFAWPKSCSENPNWHSFVLNHPFPLTDGAQEVFDEMPTRKLSFLNAQAVLGIFCARPLFVFDPGICRECKRNCLCLDVISATEKADFESSYFVFDPGGLRWSFLCSHECICDDFL